jgi:NAD(P)-dependent dehydrogenase (short-subunit alcohol dehydrogenase family)
MGRSRIKLNELFSLEGEVAVVTGALGKLGPVWIETLLDAGASVLALEQKDENSHEMFDELKTRLGGPRVKLAFADVRDRPALVRVCGQCLNEFGTPSILVNNAGIDRPPDKLDKGYLLEDIPFEENREIFEVNTLGLFLVTQVFGIEMVRAGHGSVINIGSIYASVSPDNCFYEHIRTDPPFLKPPAYGASKAAVVNLTKYLAAQWAPYGVRVNTLSPGGVLGDQDEAFKRKYCERVPLGRMATVSDLRGPLLFLASRASAYMTGTEIIIDGGFTAL